MIQSITITLDSGESQTMTLASPDTSLGFAIVDCDGIGPGSATLNGSEWVTIDGGSFESSHIPKRTINLQLRFLPTSLDESVADIRRKTYKWFPLTKEIKLTFRHRNYNGDEKIYYIYGRVERNDPNIWSENEGSTISIVCYDPYFKDINDVIGNFNQVKPLFHFITPSKYKNYLGETETPIQVGLRTRTIVIDGQEVTVQTGDAVLYDGVKYIFCTRSWQEYNKLGYGQPYPMSRRLKYDTKDVVNTSSHDIGGIFTIDATGVVVNPTIYSNTTRQVMTLEYTMHEGETIIIDTRKGNKTIYRKDANSTKMIKYLKPNSEFIEFIPGNNNIGMYCDNDVKFMNVSYVITPIHLGV